MKMKMQQIKKLFQAIDMTVGEPWKKIITFTVPMLLGNIAQQMYNTVDSIVVGNYVGDNAVWAPVLWCHSILARSREKTSLIQ